jgi:hypothetical protein
MMTKESMEELDLSTRAKRRNATDLAIALLRRIRFVEEVGLLRCPINMQDDDTYIDAENFAESVDKAINILKNAY